MTPTLIYPFEMMANPIAVSYCRDVSAYLIGRQVIAMRGRRPPVAAYEIAIHEAGHAVMLSMFGRRVEFMRIIDERAGCCVPVGRTDDDASATDTLPSVIETLCIAASGYLAHRRYAAEATAPALMAAAHELGLVSYLCQYAQANWGVPALSALRATVETCETVISNSRLVLDGLARRLEASGEIHEAEIGDCLAGMLGRDVGALWLECARSTNSQPIGAGQHSELEDLLFTAMRLASAIEQKPLAA